MGEATKSGSSWPSDRLEFGSFDQEVSWASGGGSFPWQRNRTFNWQIWLDKPYGEPSKIGIQSTLEILLTVFSHSKTMVDQLGG